MLLLLFMLIYEQPEAVGVQYAPFPEGSEEYLAAPTAFVVAQNGHLYVLDTKTCRIHIWDKLGKYIKSFGQKGEGPGEMQFPYKADVTATSLWVHDLAGKMNQFDLDGKYIKTFHLQRPRMRTFSAISDELFLVTTRRQENAHDIFNRFELVNTEGKTVKTLAEIRNESFLSPREGDNHATVKAFPPVPEIQKDNQGNIFFGFSQKPTVFKMKGESQEELRFSLITDRPDEDEIKGYVERALPCFGGDTFVIKDLPNIKIDFTHDKAYYTGFVVKGDRILFTQTPDGAIMGCGGVSLGRYYVCDVNTGKVLATEAFDYPEGSIMMLRNNHILLAHMNADDEYDLFSIKPKAF